MVNASVGDTVNMSKVDHDNKGIEVDDDMVGVAAVRFVVRRIIHQLFCFVAK